MRRYDRFDSGKSRYVNASRGTATKTRRFSRIQSERSCGATAIHVQKIANQATRTWSRRLRAKSARIVSVDVVRAASWLTGRPRPRLLLALLGLEAGHREPFVLRSRQHHHDRRDAGIREIDGRADQGVPRASRVEPLRHDVHRRHRVPFLGPAAYRGSELGLVVDAAKLRRHLVFILEDEAADLERQMAVGVEASA